MFCDLPANCGDIPTNFGFQGVQYIVAGQKCYRHKLDPSSYEPMGVSDHFNLLTDGRLGGEMPVELYGAAASKCAIAHKSERDDGGDGDR